MIRNTLGLLVRLALLSAATATLAAIILAGAKPEKTSRRIASPPSYQVLGDAVPLLLESAAHLLNIETGRLEMVPLPSGVGLGLMSPSPWEENGRRQVVGQGWSRSRTGGRMSPRFDIGIVRMSLPDGAILNRLPLPEGPVPIGFPCWIPGTSAAVLYAGSDGRLYRLDFESPRPDGAVRELPDPSPYPVAWQAAAPWTSVILKEVAWPDDRRLGGRLLASLSYRDAETGRYTDLQLWWLKLNRAGTSIVAAGRLLETTSDDDPGERRLPALVAAVDGAPALAYLAKPPGSTDFELRIAPIMLDPESNVPHAREVESKLLARDCVPVVLAASPDGRRVTVLRRSGKALKPEHVATAGAATLVEALVPEDRPPRLTSGPADPIGGSERPGVWSRAPLGGLGADQ